MVSFQIKLKYLKSISYIIFFFGFFILLNACTNSNKEENSQSEELISEHTMVVSAHPLASQVGLEILEKGGNAFDAAAAVQFALSVVYPRAGNIGGGGFAVYRQSNGEVGTLDFREKAPLLASETIYLDSLGNVIPDKSKLGIFSVGVPGTIAGMEALHRKYGKIPWDKIVAPSIELALIGFPLTKGEADVLNRYKTAFLEQNTGSNPYVKETEWVEGDSIILTTLGESLFRIGEKGSQEFYRGLVAKQIVKESNKRNGLITSDDLYNYEPIWRIPVSAQIGEYTFYSMGPPSSGGIALIQLLKGAQSFEISKYGHNSAKAIHLMTELQRRVFADRATHLGDPDFLKIPQELLLSDLYLNDRNSSINLSKATPSEEVKSGTVEVIESHETTHFSIVDKWGNAVSITTTLNGNFGSKVLVSGAGFFLNNEMDDFSIKPGVPNQFGLVGGKANAIQPEKRMLSSMSPTIVEKNGQLFMVVGTPGGSTIINTTYQTIQNVISYDMTMQEAVNASKTHSQWLPNRLFYETNQIDSVVLDSLILMGHQLEDWDKIGKMSAILILDGGKLEGAPDYLRGENSAAGN